MTYGGSIIITVWNTCSFNISRPLSCTHFLIFTNLILKIVFKCLKYSSSERQCQTQSWWITKRDIFFFYFGWTILQPYYNLLYGCKKLSKDCKTKKQTTSSPHFFSSSVFKGNESLFTLKMFFNVKLNIHLIWVYSVVNHGGFAVDTILVTIVFHTMVTFCSQILFCYFFFFFFVLFISAIDKFILCWFKTQKSNQFPKCLLFYTI